jgi:hypothetical protein
MPVHFAITSRMARRLATVMLFVIMLAGCAPAQSPEMAQAAITSRRAELRESPICLPDPSLLTPQSAPDCKFGRHALKTLDPDQWARLKVEYERQCYLRAENAVRERLRRLQASIQCDAGTRRR